MSKRKTRKLTDNQRTFLNEVKRIKQAVRRLEKRGYRFSSDVIPEMPKRVTKTVIKRLQELKTKDLYEKATALDEETGEIIGGLEKRQIEHQERARKSAETRARKKKKEEKREQEKEQYYPNGGDIIANNILDEFISKIEEIPEDFEEVIRYKSNKKAIAAFVARKNSKHTLLSLTSSVIQEIGKSGLGWRLEEQVERVTYLSGVVLYDSEAANINTACTELTTIILNRPLSYEEAKDLSEQEEYNEGHGSELYD